MRHDANDADPSSIYHLAADQQMKVLSVSATTKKREGTMMKTSSNSNNDFCLSSRRHTCCVLCVHRIVLIWTCAFLSCLVIFSSTASAASFHRGAGGGGGDSLSATAAAPHHHSPFKNCHASGDGGDDDNENHVFYSLLSLDLSSDIDEEDEEDFDDCERSSRQYDLLQESHGNGCTIISAQALMCQGGGGTDVEIEPFVMVGTNLWNNIVQEEEQDVNDENEDDDEDEDDNADDGSSSMLSNASVHRSRMISVGPSEQSYTNGYNRQQATTGSPSSQVKESSFVSTSRCQSTLTLLSIRGGGGTTTTNWLASPIARNLIVTALVTLVFEGAIGHILEFLKIVKQTAVTDISYAQVVRDITLSKGVAGLWDGFCPWGIVQAVFKGAVFGLAYSSAVRVLQPLAEQGYLPLPLALTLAGGIGGGLQGYVLSPTLLLKTRVMTNPVFREQMSMLRTTWLSVIIGFDIVATEGLSTLMKGSNVFALKRVFDWSSRYFFADLFEALFRHLKQGAPLSVSERSIASLLGGVFSTCVTLPLDVLVAKTQDSKKAGVKVSALKLFQQELHERGWSGLQKAYMQGFEARLLHVCLTTLVIKTGTPIAYNLLFPSSP